MTVTTSTTSRPARNLTNVQLVPREWRPRKKPMSDAELRFREAQARRAIRRNQQNPENVPLWQIILVAMLITGILPAILCPLLFGFGLD